MPPFHRKRAQDASTPTDATTPSPTEFITANGVKVIVQPAPPSELESEPEPEPEPIQRVVIRPPADAHREHDAIMKRLVDKYRPFIRAMLLRRGDVVPESAEDLAQRVLLVLSDEIAELKRLPPNVEGFLVDTIRNEVSNHKRGRAAEARRRAEADIEPWAAPDPEYALRHAQEKAKLERYADELPPHEKAVYCCIDREGMTYGETAAALGRPVGTVTTQIVRIRRKLKERAEESERAEALGKRWPREE
jgi:RNA polymerase sigma-70 factor (ECF subfamily)